MKKVLFTDLIGALISPHYRISEKYFGSFDNELSVVCGYINEFLSADNYVAIVTELGGQGDFGKIFDNQLARFDSYINDKFHSRIAYYLQGKLYYIGKHPFKLAIDKKEEVISDFLKDVQPPYQIYAIGDIPKDIPMLLKVEELGGESSILDTYLYRYAYCDGEGTIDEIIKNQLDVEFHFLMNQLRLNLCLEGKFNDGVYSEEQLYQLLSKSELDLEKMNRDYSKHSVLSEYQYFNYPTFSRRNKFYENYPFSKEVVQNVMNIICLAIVLLVNIILEY